MLTKLTSKQKPGVWLKPCYFIFVFAFLILSSSSFAQNKTNINSDDVIISMQGDTMACAIDKVTKTVIYYHIQAKGFDTKGKIAMTKVLKYYYKKQWYEASGTPVAGVSTLNEKARNYILSEDLNEAIATYSKLIAKDSINSTLYAEDAYVLALIGAYDVALMRLDYSWSIGANTPDVNYLTSQIFALMGYDDLAKEFWKASDKHKTPEWISKKSSMLLEKYKRKNPVGSIQNRDELIAAFKQANELAAKKLYFQSLVLFHDINTLYPNEYLPYVGYSITLEKTGALEKSAETIEKAIALMGNDAENKTKKQMLEQRLTTVKRKMTLTPMDPMPGLHPGNIFDASQPQMMAYVGGMFAPNMFNLNGKMGYFISGSSNASLDFGLTSNNDIMYSNLGLSLYTRQKALVSGAGLMMNSGNSHTTFSFKISAGVSIMNKKKTSSFDVFLDVNKGFEKQSITTYGLSVGTSLYFGKRK